MIRNYIQNVTKRPRQQLAATDNSNVPSLDGKHALLSAHVRVDPQLQTDSMCAQLSELLAHEYGIHHVTLQVEKAEDCPGGGC